MKHQTVIIVGAGIAGLSTAIALQKKGIEVEVFEAALELKEVGAGLGLGINAMYAFKHLGIYEDVVQQGRALRTFTIYDHHGQPITKTSFAEEEIGNFTIHRAKLHQTLLSKLDPTTIHLGKKVKRFETTDFTVRLHFEDGSTHHSNFVIVADGIHSNIRNQLLPESCPRYAGYTCWRSVVSNHSLDITETSETWGPKGRFGLVPLDEDRLYWFACVNAKESDINFHSFKVADLLELFKEYHNPIAQVLRQTEDASLINHDIFDIVPLKRFAFGRIVMVGDAAHATTPNMGQGACQAIEDAVVLANAMAVESDFEKAFQVFEKKRLKRTKWIIDTSRNIGQLAQIQNPLLIHIRNAALRNMPASVGARQIKKIANVDFM